MKAKTIFLSTLATVSLLASAGFGQQGNFEVGAQVGGQLIGGIDLHTTLYRRLEAGNALSYGTTLGYLLGEHYGVEFQWNHSETDARAQPVGGGSSVKLFNLTQNHYLGNFLFHLTPRDERLRPYLSFGLGANDLSSNRHGVADTTHFTLALGGGAKYAIGPHLGFRAQMQWVPTYLYSTNTGGYWCDPFWGGCWTTGQQHYLHSFDIGGGVMFRF